EHPILGAVVDARCLARELLVEAVDASAPCKRAFAGPARHEIRAQSGKMLSLVADLLPDTLTGGSEITEATAVECKELGDGMDSHLIKHVLRFDAVPKLGDGGFAQDTPSDDFQAFGGIRTAVERRECRTPFAQHLLGVAEPLGRIAPKRPVEE